MDRICIRIDGKKASTFPKQPIVFQPDKDLKEFWTDPDAQALNTPRTFAYLLGYATIMGERWKMSGYLLADGEYLLPDKSVAHYLLNEGYLQLEKADFVITAKGWEKLAKL